MRSPSRPSLLALAVLGVALPGCPGSGPGAPSTSESPPSSPASQPASLPAGHSTSTTAVGLDDLFAPPPGLPEIVARVEGEPIDRDAFVHELRQMQVELSATGVPAGTGRADILAGALERSVDHVLRRLLAAELGVEVDPARVEAWLADVERRMEADAAFAAFLLRAGKDEAQRAVDARRYVLMDGILAAVRKDVAEDLTGKARDYYDRHPQDYIERAGTEVWRIFIKAPKGMMQRDRDIARAKAEGIHRKARKNPDDFTNLAIAHSEGGKGPEGGYLGYVPAGALAPDLETQVQKAKSGTILPLWEDAVGFAIHKVGRRRDERIIPFDEVRDDIVEKIYGPTVRREVDARVKALRGAKKVEVVAPSLASLAPRLARD